MAKKPTDESKGKEVEVVVDQTELDAQFKEEKKDSKAVNSSLKEVIENLKDQTEQGKKVAQGQLDLAEMDKKIAALQGGLLGASTENAAALREQFTALKEAITASGGVSTPDQTDMIDSLKEGVESEEEKREKKKQLEMQNSALGKLSAGLEGFDKTLNGMLDGAGKAAFGFGALALLFNPQLFLDGVFFVADILAEAFNALGALLTGDVLGFLGIFGDNFIAFTGILIALAIKFKVITKISDGIKKAQELYQKALALTQSKFALKAKELMKSFGAKTGITKALVGLKKAAMAMRAKVVAQAKGMLASAKSLGVKGMIKKLVFAAKALRAKIVASSAGLLTSAKTLALGALKKLSFAAGALKGAMLAASKGLLSFLAPIAVAIKGFVIAGAVAAKGLVLAAAPLLAAAAPFLAIAAGIALVIGGIVSAFRNVKKRFESTGSILETIGGFILDIVTFPATFLKNVIGSIAGFFGFDGLAKAIKDFSITDFILGGIKKVIGFVKNLFTFEMPKFNFSIVDSILDFFGMIKDAILDFIPSWDEIKAKLNPFNWFSGKDDKEEEKQVTKAKKSAAEKRETAVENAAESVALEIESSTDSEKRQRGGPTQQRKKDVGAPAPIIEFNPNQVMTAENRFDQQGKDYNDDLRSLIEGQDSPELQEAKTVLVESQKDLEDYKERQSFTAFPDSPELQASETKYYESVIKENTATVQQLEKEKEQATKQTAERKTAADQESSIQKMIPQPAVAQEPFVESVTEEVMRDNVMQPVDFSGFSTMFERAGGFISGLFTKDTPAETPVAIENQKVITEKESEEDEMNRLVDAYNKEQTARIMNDPDSPINTVQIENPDNQAIPKPEINLAAPEMPEKIVQPAVLSEEPMADKFKGLFTGNADKRVVPRIPKTAAMVAKIPEIESSTPQLPATGITPESIVNNTVSEVQNVSQRNEAPSKLTQIISEKYGLSPEKVQAMMSAMQKSSPLISMGKSLFSKASGFIGKMFGGDDSPEAVQQAMITPAEQSTEVLLPNSPVNQLRDTQVESIGLVAQEKKQEQANNTATMVAVSGGKKVQSTNNVSSKTVNITNDVSMDSLLREFAYNPNG
jgi:hypothetical protein